MIKVCHRGQKISHAFCLTIIHYKIWKSDSLSALKGNNKKSWS